MRRASGWRVIIAYGLVCAATQVLWLTYAAITTETARHYGVSVGAVGWLAEIFPRCMWCWRSLRVSFWIAGFDRCWRRVGDWLPLVGCSAWEVTRSLGRWLDR